MVSSVPCPHPTEQATEMHLSSYWFIAALPSTVRKEHCIWLTSRAQWSLSSPCKELAERRMFGVGKNGKALTLQMTLESFSKTQHHCVLSWSHGITECYIINPQTDKQTNTDGTGLLQNHNTCLSKEQRALNSKGRARRGPQSRNTGYSTHTVPVSTLH